MILLENGEKLFTSLAFKLINSVYVNGIDLAWGSTLYKNDRLGFSFEYKEQIRKSKDYRKYPLAMNDVITFRNSLFIKSKSAFLEYRNYYPLYMP